MHPRTRELLDYLDAQREVLRSAFGRVPQRLRDLQPSPDRWSPAGIVEHLSIVEERVSGRLAARIREARRDGLETELETLPIIPALEMDWVTDRTRRIKTPESAAPTGLGAEPAWAALERGGAAVREILRQSDGLTLGRISLPHPVFGDFSLYQWFAFIGAHEARHAAQIDEVATQLARDTFVVGP